MRCIVCAQAELRRGDNYRVNNNYTSLSGYGPHCRHMLHVYVYISIVILVTFSCFSLQLFLIVNQVGVL